jgi:hypothetical protein
MGVALGDLQYFPCYSFVTEDSEFNPKFDLSDLITKQI